MGKYKYQTIQVRPTRIPGSGSGPSTRGRAVGAAVELVDMVFDNLNQRAVQYRVNQELENLEPEIEERIRTSTDGADPGFGVLVHVGIQEWATPDFTGTRAQMFSFIHIAGAGINPRKVYQDEVVNKKRWEPGVPDGWRLKNLFIWVTKEN